VSDEYAGLSSAERDRLERFARAFEDIDPNEYALLVGTAASDEAAAGVRDLVNQALGSPSRRAAAKRAMQAFSDAAAQAMARRFRVAELLLGPRGLVARPAEQVRFLVSLERTVAAVIVWDQLTDDEREAVAGPWARLVDRALGAA
jgi:hypothetical protein